MPSGCKRRNSLFRGDHSIGVTRPASSEAAKEHLITESETRSLAGTLRRLQGLIKRYERYAKAAETEMLEFEVTDEIRLGRMLRFYMFDGFVRGLRAELEYLEGHSDALERHFKAVQEIDYTEIFRDPPELDGETVLN